MSKLQILKKIINTDFHSATNKLEEKECKPPMVIRINDEEGAFEYFLSKFDIQGKDTFPFFSGISGLKKVCDYILFFEHRSKLRIIISELKVGRDNLNANRQLDAAEEFITYLINSAQRIGEEISIQDIKIYKVRFSYSRISKKRNTKMTDPLHHVERNLYDYNSDEIRFRYFKHA